MAAITNEYDFRKRFPSIQNDINTTVNVIILQLDVCTYIVPCTYHRNVLEVK